MVDRIRKLSFSVSSPSSSSAVLLSRCSFFKGRVSLLDFYAKDRILCNGKIIGESVPVQQGDVLTVLTPQSFEPVVSSSFSILFEDEHLLVVDKPAPLPLHPAGRFYFNTLTSFLQENGYSSLFPVHRLDKETSGVVVFAKSKEVAVSLSSQFVEQKVRKVYLALIEGVVPDGVVNLPLKKVSRGEIRDLMIVADDGLPSQTEFQTIDSSNSVSLLLIRPRSGRRHQIRAHLASLGSCLIGEKLYHRDPSFFIAFMKDPRSFSSEEISQACGASRHFLHAFSLSFTHPVSGEVVSFSSPFPSDMVEKCKQEKIYYSKVTKYL